MQRLPPELEQTATSFALLGATSVEREPLLVDLLEALEQRLSDFAAAGLEPMLQELRAHDVLSGQQVRVAELKGIGRGVDASGALLVEDAAGRTHRITSGTVELG